MTWARALALQELSKTLFGQQHRLAVMIAIAKGDGIVNPGDLAAALQFRAQSSIQNPLRDLEAAGLITRAPTSAGRTYYRRNDSLAWAWVIELAQRLDSATVSR